MDQPQHKSNSSQGAIIYLADPMCSWCYGFREEVTRLQAMQWGIRGFPSILIRWKEKLGRLTQGFARFDDMEKRMEPLLNKLSL